ncbi:MAG: hypothetical protein FJX67_02935 [Alphaproteobacteria bacterium]|nr:hypothetical protein [Alphaproteobacteria bacterium]
MDENKSPYLAANVRRFTKLKTPPRKNEEFEESNLKHAINGRLFANLDGLAMRRCERVRWYVVALGSEKDPHTPRWHGNTGLMDGKRVDVVDLLPASSRIVDMRPDAGGIWMFHCHIHDHMDAGMSVLYTVEGGEVGDCP